MYILQFGPPRSGTTMVSQTLRVIFNECIDLVIFKDYPRPPKIIAQKTHTFERLKGDGSPPISIVGAYRDFRDAMVSKWRANLSRANKYSSDALNRQMTETEIYRFFSVIESVQEANMMRQCYPKMLWLKYEKFYQDIDYLIDKLCFFYKIEVSSELREIVNNSVNIDINRKRAAKMNTFSEFDNISGIHGHHIFKGKVGGWKDCVPVNFHELVNNFFKDSLISWGYDI